MSGQVAGHFCVMGSGDPHVQYNVAQLLQEDVGATRQYEFDEPPTRFDDGSETSGPITGAVKLTRMNRSILAEARGGTSVRQQCSRCLEDLTAALEFRFAEEFYPTIDLRTGLPATPPSGGTGFMLTDTHELDLTEPIRQYILMALPMKPLCRPDCAGICPECGKDLNLGPCACSAEPPDPRLSRLAEWLKANRES